MKVRLVTFDFWRLLATSGDFWQTLLADTRESAAAAHALRLAGLRDALAAAGHRYEAAALEAADARALTALDTIWAAHRDVPPGEQVGIFLAALDAALPEALGPGPLAIVARAYAEPVLTHRPVVAPGAVEAIRALADRGLRLGIISNTGRTPGTVLRRLLAEAGVLDTFGVLSFSDEVGARKPAALIFHRTLGEAECAPDTAVHVGDDPVNDVVGARAVGMRALHYVPDGGAGAGAADAVLRRFTDLPDLLARLTE